MHMRTNEIVAIEGSSTSSPQSSCGSNAADTSMKHITDKRQTHKYNAARSGRAKSDAFRPKRPITDGVSSLKLGCKID